MKLAQEKSGSETSQVSGPSLRRKALGAAGWSLAQTASQYVFRLGSNLIMTRLLMPEAFGLLGFASLIITALTLFTDIGIMQSIVRDKDGEGPHFLRVAWTVKIVRSLIISGGVVAVGIGIALLAPHVAPAGTVYVDPRMPLLVALTSITTLMQGLESTNKDVSIRRMDYRRYTTVVVVAQAMSIATMIGFAWASPTVWALLAGMLSNNIYLCILSHIAFPGPRMKLVWDRAITNRLWDFGRWIMLSSTFTFIQSSADKFLLGALLTSTAFGLYVIAQVWTTAVRNVVLLLGDRVGFPAVSQVMRERPADLHRVYRRFHGAIDAMCVAGFLGLLFGSKFLIALLYTPDYDGAAHYLALMSLTVLTARFEPLNNLLMSMGNSRATTVISFSRAAALCILLPLANSLGGVDAIILAVAILPILTAPYALSQLATVLDKRQITANYFWIAGSLIAVVITFAGVRAAI